MNGGIKLLKISAVRFAEMRCDNHTKDESVDRNKFIMNYEPAQNVSEADRGKQCKQKMEIS